MPWDDDKSTAADPDNPAADEQLSADEWDAHVADQKSRVPYGPLTDRPPAGDVSNGTVFLVTDLANNGGILTEVVSGSWEIMSLGDDENRIPNVFAESVSTGGVSTEGKCLVEYAGGAATEFVETKDYNDDAAALINNLKDNGATTFRFGMGTYTWGENVALDDEGITITTLPNSKQWPRFIVDVGAGNYAITNDFHSHQVTGMRWVGSSGRLLNATGGFSGTFGEWRIVGTWDDHVIAHPGFSNSFRDIRADLDAGSAKVVDSGGFMNTWTNTWFSGFTESAVGSVGNNCTWVNPNWESRADKTGVVAECAGRVTGGDESWTLINPNFERMLDANGDPAAPGLILGDPNTTSQWGRGTIIGGQSTEVTHGIRVYSDAKGAADTVGVHVFNHDWDTSGNAINYNGATSGYLYVDPFDAASKQGVDDNRVIGRDSLGPLIMRSPDGTAKYRVRTDNSGNVTTDTL